MNLQAIIVINCLGFTMMMILMVSSHLVRQRRSLGDKLFTAMIILTAVACIDEMFSFLIDGKSFVGVRPLLVISNSYLYLATILVPFLWCAYVDLRMYRNMKRLRERYRFLGIPVGIVAVELIANIWSGTAFSISEDNTYHRELGGYVVAAVAILYIGYSVLLVQMHHERTGKMKFFPIWMFLTPVFVGVLVQSLVYGISLAWCTVSLGLIGLYMSLQNESAYTDPLTKLYNRNYLDHVIRDLDRRKMCGLMIDIDFFKSINDTFGHAAGDAALVDAAMLFCQTAPLHAVVVRFAGDEFIILLRDSEISGAEKLKLQLQEAAERFNESGLRKYRLSFSIGCAVYEPGHSSPDSFLHEMDEQMYIEKRRTHTQRVK